jgi:hypothetical protein
MARVELLLAQALWDSRRDRGRARELAERARVDGNDDDRRNATELQARMPRR